MILSNTEDGEKKDSFPDGWKATPLINFPIEYGDGLTKRNRTGGSVPVYGSNGIVGWHSKAITNGPTIIIGRKGSVGAVNLSDVPCWPIDTTYYIDEFPPDYDYKFLYFFLRSQTISDLDTSTTIPGINRNDLGNILIPKPPLDEQCRIVARLETILAQIRTARAALDGIPELLKTFRQSILAAAFRGELTERNPNDEPASVLLDRIRAERRRRWEQNLLAKGKDPTKAVYDEPPAPDPSTLADLPEGWVWTTLDLILDRIEAGHSFKAQGRPAQEGENGVIKVSAMTWGKFLPEENKALMPDTDPGNTPRICKGDLLISRANTVEFVGAVVLVEQNYPNLLLSDKSLRLVPVTKEISKEFLLYALRTRPVRDIFEGEATGVSESMRNISQDKIKTAPISLPPLNEQAKIIQIIKQANALSDSIEQTVATCLLRLDELEQSTLAKAFRGEL